MRPRRRGPAALGGRLATERQCSICAAHDEKSRNVRGVESRLHARFCVFAEAAACVWCGCKVRALTPGTRPSSIVKPNRSGVAVGAGARCGPARLREWERCRWRLFLRNSLRLLHLRRFWLPAASLGFLGLSVAMIDGYVKIPPEARLAQMLSTVRIRCGYGSDTVRPGVGRGRSPGIVKRNSFVFCRVGNGGSGGPRMV